MERNKFIYSLSDAALVVNADCGRGGTWQGAAEHLKKFRFVSVYVRTGGAPSEGLEGLRDRGAKPWPEPKTPNELHRILYDAPSRDEKPLAALQSDPNRSEHPDIDVPEIHSRVSEPGDLATWDRTVEAAVKRHTHSAVSQESEAAAPAAKLRFKLLSVISGEMRRKDILDALNLKSAGNLREKYLKPCLESGLIEMKFPTKPKSKNQRFRLTPEGRKLLAELQARNEPLFQRRRPSSVSTNLPSNPGGMEQAAAR